MEVKQSGKHEFTKKTRHMINKNYIKIFIYIYIYIYVYIYIYICTGINKTRPFIVTS